MSTSLILGLLIGLAVGGPLYYLFRILTQKRKFVARKQIMEMRRQELVEKEKRQEQEESGEQAELEEKQDQADQPEKEKQQGWDS